MYIHLISYLFDDISLSDIEKMLEYAMNSKDCVFSEFVIMSLMDEKLARYEQEYNTFYR